MKRISLPKESTNVVLNKSHVECHSLLDRNNDEKRCEGKYT